MRDRIESTPVTAGKAREHAEAEGTLNDATEWAIGQKWSGYLGAVDYRIGNLVRVELLLVSQVIRSPQIPVLSVFVIAITRSATFPRHFDWRLNPDLVAVVASDVGVKRRDSLHDQIVHLRNDDRIAERIRVPDQPLVADLLATTGRDEYLRLQTSAIERTVPGRFGDPLLHDKVVNAYYEGATESVSQRSGESRLA